MADEIKGAAQSSGAPTYVQQEANATPKVTDPTNVHEALTASTEPNATSIGNLDAKNRRMYKHIPAEMRRDYLEDEAEQARVDANQDAVIEDHVGRLASGSKGFGKYGHITGAYPLHATDINDGKSKNYEGIFIEDGFIGINIAENNISQSNGGFGVIRPGNGVGMRGDTGCLDVKPATASTIGGVKVGDNIAVTDDGTISTHAPYTLPVATTNTIGGVKVGDNIAVTDDGTISTHAPYTLPVATTNTIGGVKVGDNISVTDDGTISTDVNKAYVDEKVASGSYVLSAATSTSLGGVRPYGNGLVLDSDGGLHAAPATADAVGVVKPSTSITAASDGTIKINPSIFSDGLTATDAQVSADLGFIGEHLAGDALYYNSANGLMLKCGTGLHIDNDAVSVDADTLPLATASTRGTVKVGSGLSIAEDGTLSAASAGCDVSYSGFHTSNSTFTSISFNYAFYNRSGDTIPLECKGTVINKTAFTTGTKMQFGVNYSGAKFDNNPVGVFETIMATKKWFGVLVSTSSSTAPKHTVIDSDNIVVTYDTSSGFSRAEFEVTVPFDVAANSTIYFYMM